MKHVNAMFRNHPSPASDAGDAAYALVTAATECALVCTTCADACLAEDDPTALRRCIRTDLDCAEICQATARLIARPGEQHAGLLRAQLEACATACRACADECDRHAGAHEHCAVCAAACRACAEACDQMVEALVA